MPTVPPLPLFSPGTHTATCYSVISVPLVVSLSYEYKNTILYFGFYAEPEEEEIETTLENGEGSVVIQEMEKYHTNRKSFTLFIMDMHNLSCLLDALLHQPQLQGGGAQGAASWGAANNRGYKLW